VKRALAALLLAATGCGGGGEGGGRAPTAAGTPAPPPGPQMTVTGTALYEDRVFDGQGFTGEIQDRPIRFAVVQLVAEGDGNVLGETSTRADGTFTLSAPVAEGLGVHLAVVSRIAQPLTAEVQNASLQTYALAGPTLIGGARPFTQDFLARTSDLGGVFNILDSVIQGGDTVRALLPGAVFGRLRVLWSTSNRDRTEFNGNNNTIRLRGHAEDPDEYDDPVVLHEFGHYVAHFFSRDTSPGGDHSLFEDGLPLPLTWSEGFATWFGSEVRQSPVYLDSFGTGAFVMELETPTFASRLRGPGNEMAVAASLWDVSDPANEPHDGLDRRRAQLWDVINVHFRAVLPPDVTVQSFCEGWVARGHGQLAELRAAFADRGINCP
jgi:hypothetical protein